MATVLRYGSKSPPSDRVGLVAVMAFASRALADGGSLEVQGDPQGPPLIVVRRNRKSLPDLLVVKATAGRLGRDTLEAVREHLGAIGIEYGASLTKRRQWLKEVRVPIALEGAAAASGLANVCHEIFGLTQPVPLTYQVTYLGPFDPDCELQEHDPVQPPRSFKLGFAVGRMVGRLLRPFKLEG